MSKERKLADELCQIVTTFLCREGQAVDIETCLPGPHLFTKGGTQAVCTVKLTHGTTYNIEFVYRYWAYKLHNVQFPFSPCFIISNNGLASTLKCFLCTPRDVTSQFSNCCSIDSDVYLAKNTSIILSQDDFIKFKTNLVFTKDLDIFSSMVVFRTYLTDHRQALQFLVVKSQNPKRLGSILGSISETCCYPQFRLAELEHQLCKQPAVKKPYTIKGVSHWMPSHFFASVLKKVWPPQWGLVAILVLILIGYSVYWILSVVLLKTLI